MSVKHDHERERHDSNNTNDHTKKGWRYATESSWTLWHTGGSRQGHPRYTSVTTEEGCGWPEVTSTDRRPRNDNKTKTSLEINVLSATGVVIHLESFTVAEPVPETGDLRRDVVELRERTRR